MQYLPTQNIIVRLLINLDVGATAGSMERLPFSAQFLIAWQETTLGYSQPTLHQNEFSLVVPI
jgi:hypothetical protein